MLDISLSVILAGYNEESNVVLAVEKTRKMLEDNFENWEIILVDDGSKDNTFIEMQKCANIMPEIKFLPDCACLFSKRNTDITSNIAKA